MRLKMKVAIVVPYLYDGGAERVAGLWASGLADDNAYEVHLITMGVGGCIYIQSIPQK